MRVVVVPSDLILVDAEGNHVAGGDRSRAINTLGCKVDYPVFAARPVRNTMLTVECFH